MDKPQQHKIPVTLDANGDMYMDQLEALVGLITQGKPNWKLVKTQDLLYPNRKRDSLTKHSVDILWIEWNEDGTFKSIHNDFAIGRSLIMSPFTEFFTWQTTPITKIIAATADSNTNYHYCIEGKIIYKNDTVDAIALTDRFTTTDDSIYYYNSDSSLVSFLTPYTVYKNTPQK